MIFHNFRHNDILSITSSGYGFIEFLQSVELRNYAIPFTDNEGNLENIEKIIIGTINNGC